MGGRSNSIIQTHVKGSIKTNAFYSVCTESHLSAFGLLRMQVSAPEYRQGGSAHG